MSGAGGERAPDWSFAFEENGDRGGAVGPPPAVVGELELAKASLQRRLDAAIADARVLQSLVCRAGRDGLSVDEIAVHSGLGLETVAAVLAGASLLDAMFGGAASAPGHPHSETQPG